tara:strand:+ start:52 stop:2658 length:2607 start_codon:yes stop_codon:yes gene_type:complete
MTSNEIRSQFFDFFKSKNHKIVDSAPIVQKNDPTLMFTNAGMNQFKDFFLENRKPDSLRVANTQKCLRVSGKHNDLEEVGVDTYHHTMFEMLGNWSFGDYFKKEAIEWAWEILTDVYKIDKDRLYITIFSGDKKDKLTEDAEARELWKRHISNDRILGFDRMDNFWEMGEMGPCGPCSEIHVDIRSDEERKQLDGRTLVNKDHPQVIEIWNLVFIQYNRIKSGALTDLPNKHIDTGMGLERLAMVMQLQQSNYDTDLFAPAINQLQILSGIKYKKSDSKTDVAIRVIADHLRAVAFCIADGQLPSNNGAGYVVRRILRRAIRYGYSTLNIKQPFIYSLVQLLADKMGGVFEELNTQSNLIKQVIKEEEESFLRTLDKGIDRLTVLVKQTKGYTVSGKAVFELYDTYGFPLDLTLLILKEQNKTADIQEFESELLAQKKRSRNASEIEKQDWIIVKESKEEGFVGYDSLKSESQITKYREVSQNSTISYHVVFDKTPFYAESGGQVGDTGWLIEGESKIEVTNTQKENDVVVHYLMSLPKVVSNSFELKVDAEKRQATELNHTATHLMHYALREVLGTHVEQRGSLVNANYLRFDFSHFQKMSNEDIEKVEELVNTMIRENTSLSEHNEIPISDAKEMGAMALFGEKYGESVRVIQFDKSVELCGGTHVKATGGIGLFKIISEQAVSSGIRRVEALTGKNALDYINGHLNTIQQLKTSLKTNDLIKSIDALFLKNKLLNEDVEKLKSAQASGLKTELIQKATVINDKILIAEVVDVDSKKAKDLSFQIKSEIENSVVLLIVLNNGKVNLNLAVSDALVKNKGLHAGNMIREIAKEVGGGGGGQPFFASAGGSDPSGVEKAINKLKEILA